MESRLFIEGTQLTPEIDFDIEVLRFRISGRSMPENSEKFYNQIISWMRGNLNERSVKASVDISLDYYNTGSFIRLMALFNLLHEFNLSGSEFSVRWLCEEDDEDNKADGLSFKEVVKIPFHIIEI